MTHGQGAGGPRPPDFWVGLDPELRFEDRRPLRLLAYWQDKRRDGRLPARRDIDPAELREHLGNLVLIDVQREPLRMRYRLIGSAITHAMQRDSTGKYYDELYGPELLAQIETSFRWLIANKAPLRASGEAFYPDRNFYRYEVLNLPLAEDGENVDMVLGELIFHLKRA
jgi:hypothetical protein